jgi:hypothetical protein
MLTDQIADIIAVCMLAALLLATCFIAHDRGLEASGVTARLASIEAQIDRIRPVPRIHIQRGTVYNGMGEIVVDAPDKE